MLTDPELYITNLDNKSNISSLELIIFTPSCGMTVS